MKLDSLLVLHMILVLLGALLLSLLISISIFYVPGVIIRLINNTNRKESNKYDNK